MAVIEIKPDVYWIGVNDRTTDLFEGLWPIIQEGISYNAYFVNDQKKAIIDLTKSFKTDEFLHHINEIADVSKIDYIVINHMEPDHTGILKTLRRISREATIVGSPKTQEMLESFYGIRENVRAVQNGETIPLGNRTLKFIHTPWVHWPETIMTFETSHGILFPCDGFGGYGSLQGAIFDDTCKNMHFYEKEALRYFANVLAMFSPMVLKAMDQISDLSIRVIAPSHGLIWRERPQHILDLYKRWSTYASEERVTLIYGSMYGNTENMVEAVANGISSRNVAVEIFDAARTHASYILPSMWISRGIMIGAPTYEAKLFPPVASVLHIAIHKGVRNKKVARFGSYGWSGGAQKHFEEIIGAKWDLTDSFEFAGSPDKDELKRGEEFGARFAATITEDKED
jgi:anaerobic nitric oxide reductase flavorubredoxin